MNSTDPISVSLCKINVTDELTKLERANNGISRKAFANLGQLVWKRCRGRRRTPEELEQATNKISPEIAVSSIIEMAICFVYIIYKTVI